MSSAGGRLIPVAGATLIGLFGLAIAVGATQMPASRTADVGSGRLPLLIGIAILALAALHGVRSAFAATPAATDTPPDRRPAAILFALLIVYCALIPFVGMLAGTAVFMMATLIWLDTPRRWLRSLAITVLFLAVVHALFAWVIGTPLP